MRPVSVRANPDGLHDVVDRHRRLGELSGEFAGCLVMMLIGLGAEAAVLTGGGHFGDFAVITLGWGLGVTCAVYVVGPAVRAAPEPGVHHRAGGVPEVPVAQGAAVRGGAAGRRVRGRADRPAGYNELLMRYDPGTTIKGQVAFSTLPGNGAVPGRASRPRSSPR